MYDVIIAGAGPVGLLACELRLWKVSVLVVEHRRDRMGRS
jgi:2-polyprenyl-6-methoxyphenol hydroxylase-like FAD-dependent oxidoreductase